MSSILNKFKNIKAEKEKKIEEERISKHPLVNEDIDSKIHYLNGLALVMNVDNEISEDEKCYFEHLISVINLPSSVLEDFITFANEPNQEQIVELLESIKAKQDIKFCFIYDCYIIAMNDGKILEEEEELLELYFEMLHFKDYEISFYKDNSGQLIKPYLYSNFFYQFAEKLSANKLKEEETTRYYRYAADLDNHDAQYKLAYRYLDGIGTEVNKKEAFNYMLGASKSNKPEIIKTLADYYFKGVGTEVELTSAFELYSKSAHSGFAGAQSELGHCFENGSGTTKDLSKAVKWYELAIEQDDPSAKYRLGMLYYFGNGVEYNQKKAIDLIELAAEQNYAEAQFSLALFFTSISISISTDFFSLGMSGGVDEKNYSYVDDKCFDWFLKAAENGHVFSQMIVGKCYLQEISSFSTFKTNKNFNCSAISADYSKAVKWLKIASSNDEPYAQYLLGVCYENGIGVKKNKIVAKKLIDKSIKNGSKDMQREGYNPLRLIKDEREI